MCPLALGRRDGEAVEVAGDIPRLNDELCVGIDRSAPATVLDIELVRVILVEEPGQHRAGVVRPTRESERESVDSVAGIPEKDDFGAVCLPVDYRRVQVQVTILVNPDVVRRVREVVRPRADAHAPARLDLPRGAKRLEVTGNRRAGNPENRTADRRQTHNRRRRRPTAALEEHHAVMVSSAARDAERSVAVHNREAATVRPRLDIVAIRLRPSGNVHRIGVDVHDAADDVACPAAVAAVRRNAFENEDRRKVKIADRAAGRRRRSGEDACNQHEHNEP